ncbi:hypothetical protein GCM10010219_48460 [Streptomyces netropsis]|nr:hypothetical protein GCM10010219_48460 [Streptomyces netropsis]
MAEQQGGKQNRRLRGLQHDTVTTVGNTQRPENLELHSEVPPRICTASYLAHGPRVPVRTCGHDAKWEVGGALCRQSVHQIVHHSQYRECQ